MRDEYCSPWQVVNFNGHLLIVDTVAGWFFSTAEEGQVSALVEGKQVVFFLLSCLIFRTENTS